VFSVEIVEPLHEVAKRIVAREGYARIALRLGDGYYGWAEHAPYDAMLIKESAADVPPPLWQQLKPGGRMVIPLGPPAGPQVLTLVRKDAAGRRQDTPILPVRFAPFQGGDRI
jgi:protein-L-isoaspartate(D-aspartate) O-methyltransferase